MTNGITMTNAVIECILSRSAAKYYDPAATLSDDQIRELVRIGTTAPTSFHLQNWRFIAVRTSEAKARLSPIAWNQPPISEAAVTFIVCGQLADSSVIPDRLAPLVEAGVMPADRKSVVSGKSVSVRVDLGGRRIIKKKNKRKRSYKNHK